MKKITYLVEGMRPYDRHVNQILSALDLGVDGAFIEDGNLVTVTLKPDATEAQILAQPVTPRRLKPPQPIRENRSE